MTEIKHKDAILDTIDQLRKRKARPDLERICHMLERKHGVNAVETRSLLEELVRAGTVYKVDYKGNTSYRNVAKWKGWGTKHYINSRKISRIIGTAVRATAGLASTESENARTKKSSEVSGQAPNESNGVDASTGGDASANDLSIGGASLEDISVWLKEHYPDFLQNDLENLVEHEVEMGHLDRLPNGRFVFVRVPTHKRKSSVGSTSAETSPGSTKSKTGTCDENVAKKDEKKKVKSKERIMSDSRSEDFDAGEQIETSNSSVNSGVFEKDSSKSPSSTPSPSQSGGLLLKMPSTSSLGTLINSKDYTGRGLQVTTMQEGVSGETSNMADIETFNHSQNFHGAKSVPKLPSPGKVKRGRPVNKRKKIKKSLGPDFESYWSVKRSRVDGATGEVRPGAAYAQGADVPMEPVCDYCLLGKERNRRGEEEDLLICKDCQAKAHPSCMDYSEDLARRARTSPWQCIDCKTCCICEDAGDPDAMLFCDACDKGYHMTCHNPVVEDKPTGKWICSRCLMELGMDTSDSTETTANTNHHKHTDAASHGLPTPSESPVQFHENPVSSSMKVNGELVTPIPRLAMTMKAEVPDASDWTIDDVAAFFTEMGFPDQAEVLREQEIDGKSLLLLKRSDVLTGLSFKLGPALKIYAHVQRLQTQGQIVL